MDVAFNVTPDPANCAVSVVCLLGTVMAAGKRNGLLFTLLFKLLGIFTKGKAPSQTAVSRALAGTSARRPWLMALAGGVLIVGGIVCAIVGKTKKPKADILKT